MRSAFLLSLVGPAAALYSPAFPYRRSLTGISLSVERPQRSSGVLLCDEGPGTLVRLDKLLAERGAGSRKDVDRMIRKGMVEIEDLDSGEMVVVGKAGAKLKVPWDSSPYVDGFDYPPPPLLCAYHKPLGPVTTTKDKKGRLDFASVLPLSWQKLMQPVGRIDAETTGLLLFARDGEMTHRLLHPKYSVGRDYVAEVDGAVDAAALGAALAAGVQVAEEDETERSVSGSLVSVEAQSVRVRVTDVEQRVVRRMLAGCGHPVSALALVRIGEVELDDLGIDEGESAEVGDEEIEWVLGLKPTASSPIEAMTSSAAMGSECAPAAKPASPPPPPPPKPPREPRDLEAEMEEAARREWQPPESLVTIVQEEGDATREEALDALRRHDGDVVAALEDVLEV